MGFSRDTAADIEPPKLVEAEPVVYSNAELSLILCSVRDDLDNVIFHAFVYAGLRRHELVALQWQAVNFERRYMSVRGKGGKLRRVPLHPRLARVLELRRLREPRSQLVLGNGGSLRNVNWRLARLLQRAGVDGGNRPAHRFRKTMATLLYEADVRTDTIDRIMGWAPTSVRQRYYTRIADDALYQAVLTLPDLSARREMAR